VQIIPDLHTIDTKAGSQQVWVKNQLHIYYHILSWYMHVVFSI